MTHILQIDASARPGIRGHQPHGSHSRAMTHRFIQRWLAASPSTDVTHRDVGMAPPPPMSAAWIEAAFTPAGNRTPAMQEALAVSDELIAELRRADVIVLGVPMYNFGPPSAFKGWIDNIVRIDATFRFDPAAADPYTPLLADRPRPVVLLTSRGEGELGPDGAKAHRNHLDPMVRQALELTGLADWHSIAIENDEFGGDALARSVQAAMVAIDELVDRLIPTVAQDPSLAHAEPVRHLP